MIEAPRGLRGSDLDDADAEALDEPPEEEAEPLPLELEGLAGEEAVLAMDGDTAATATAATDGKPRPATVFWCGLLPAVGFGCDVTGLSPAATRIIQDKARRISKVDGRGRRRGLALLFCSKDPGVLQGAPLIRWAKEWWRATDKGQQRGGTLRRIRLLQIFAAIRRRFASKVGQPWRSVVQGPVSAALWACTRVGWEMTSASSIKDERGRELSLLTTPPVLLERKYKQAYAEAQVALAIHKALPETLDNVSSDRGELKQGDTLWLAPLRRVYRSLKSPPERHCFLTGVTGTPMTRAMRHRLGKRATSTCAFCQREDTLWHRLWLCEETAVFRRRLPRGLRRMAGRCAEPSLLLTKAWAAAPDVAPPPTQGTVVGYSPTKCFVPATEVVLRPDGGRCFGDGSAYHNRIPELATAGWAMVQVSGEGCLVGARFGSVPSVLPQTAASGEHYAPVGGLSTGHATAYDVAIDCAGVSTAHERGDQWATAERRPMAFIWRQLRRIRMSVRWVKAHLVVGDGPVADQIGVVGNTLADGFAKLGAALHAVPQGTVRSCRVRAARVRAMALHIAQCPRGVARFRRRGCRGHRAPRSLWTTRPHGAASRGPAA